MQTPRRVLLTVAVGLLLAAPFAPAAEPGGWGHLGTGGPAATPALEGARYTLNGDAPGGLLVGGAFTNAGGVPDADYLARWTGSRWEAIGATPLGGGVQAIAYRGGKIYAGGLFTNAGGNPNADYVAVWDSR